jgi:hypothetical protein
MWSRGLVQGANAAAMMIKEINCRECRFLNIMGTSFIIYHYFQRFPGKTKNAA